MLKKDKTKAKAIAKKLADARYFLSHGRPIRWKLAKELGLNVVVVKRHSQKYEAVWRYFNYALTFLARKKANKLFENDRKVSLIF